MSTIVLSAGGTGGHLFPAQALAGELAPDRIRVNSIAPGPIDTPIHATWAADLEEAYRWLKSQVPLGRIGDPDEVARWIALLLSPVSAFMTGAVIPLDGGAGLVDAATLAFAPESE